ncbi:group II intron maturase-specific domain-containing protein [Streptomyces mirabilis]|uniref:group II intron maturase-specific domain-containing protein n=1 Tax=Streptomyces mirabilis TaxID=68239 RepID=UPI0036B3045C
MTERPVSAVVADLNPVLRGWAAYFRNGNSGRKFNVVDGYVHERLAIFASAKHRQAPIHRIAGTLDKTLPEPFASDRDERHEAARRRLRSETVARVSGCVGRPLPAGGVGAGTGQDRTASWEDHRHQRMTPTARIDQHRQPFHQREQGTPPGGGRLDQKNRGRLAAQES